VSGQGSGVYGESTDGAGVHGHGVNKPGVIGESDKNSGVYGDATDSVGVYGHSWNVGGVAGYSEDGVGIAGGSYRSVGVIGSSTKDTGVWAQTDSGIAPALVAQGARGGNAARFEGHVRIEGNLDLWGPGTAWIGGSLFVSGQKAAAVPHPDGSHRALYCMESPESWFEDFGRARLVRGKAKVRLDRTFAAVVRTGDYHVFLTPEGESEGLYVSRRTRAGFDVREQHRGTSTMRFSYRVVARRKDVSAPRFQKVRPPKPVAVTHPKLIKLPAPPTLPKPSERPKLPTLPTLPKLPRRLERPKLSARSGRAGTSRRSPARKTRRSLAL